jgi:2-aminoadipate transaminase
MNALERFIVRQERESDAVPGVVPHDALRAAYDAELAENGPAAVQYSTIEGKAPLSEWVAEPETAKGVPTDPDQVLITAGSQQALDLLTKAFVEPASRTPSPASFPIDTQRADGAPVLVQSPTYLGAIQAFSAFEPDYRIVGIND